MKLLLVGAVCMSLPAFAQQQMGVNQFAQKLAVLCDNHVPDLAIAKEIKNTRLTESFSRETLDALAVTHRFGPYALFALDLKIANTALLPPPPDRILHAAPPNAKTVAMVESRMKLVVDGLSNDRAKYAGRREEIVESSKGSDGEQWFPVSAPGTQELKELPVEQLLTLRTAKLKWDHWEVVKMLDGSRDGTTVFRFTADGARRGLVYLDNGQIDRLVEVRTGHVGPRGVTAVVTTETDFGYGTVSGNVVAVFPLRVISIDRAPRGSYTKTTVLVTGFHPRR